MNPDPDDKASLPEAVEFLRLKANAEPKGSSVNLLVVTPDEGTSVTLHLDRIPFDEAVGYVADLVGLEACVEPHAVVLRPGFSGNLKTREYRVPEEAVDAALARPGFHSNENDPFGDPTPAGPQTEARSIQDWFQEVGISFPEGSAVTYDRAGGRIVMRNTRRALEIADALFASIAGVAPRGQAEAIALRTRLRETRIDEIVFERAILPEAVDFLRKKTAEQPVNIVVYPQVAQGGVTPEWPPDRLRLRDVPLEMVVKYVAELSGYEVVVDSHSVLLLPVYETVRFLHTRRYGIASPELRTRLAVTPEAAREWLSGYGASFPEGRTTAFEPVGGQLIVRLPIHQREFLESVALGDNTTR